jgi:hypothetical protein
MRAVDDLTQQVEPRTGLRGLTGFAGSRRWLVWRGRLSGIPAPNGVAHQPLAARRSGAAMPGCRYRWCPPDRSGAGAASGVGSAGAVPHRCWERASMAALLGRGVLGWWRPGGRPHPRCRQRPSAWTWRATPLVRAPGQRGRNQQSARRSRRPTEGGVAWAGARTAGAPAVQHDRRRSPADKDVGGDGDRNGCRHRAHS